MSEIIITGPHGPVIVGGSTPEEIAASIALQRAAWARDEHRRQVAAEAIADARVALGWISDYLALDPPTQQQVVQQVDRLSLISRGTIRLLGSLIAAMADVLDDD